MSKKDGFTLVELLLVVVILGTLAAIAVPLFDGIVNRAKESEAQLLLKQVLELELAYKENYGAYADIDNLIGWLDPSPVYFTASINNSPTSFTAILQAKDEYESLRDFFVTDAGKIGIYTR